MRETWYVLEDGNMADPIDVAPDVKGKLHHKNGVAVAMKGDVPHTRGVDVEEERAKASKKAEKPEPKPEAPAEAKVAAAHDNRQMQAKPGKPYKTR